MIALSELNSVSTAKFVQLVGPLFEHSPWVAEATCTKRPFESVDQLHRVLCGSVLAAGEQKQLALISAHPDLVGRAALAGTLTVASSREQASAGLDTLTAEEVAAFQNFNAAYHKRFGFPFVICARLNKKEAILAAFPLRLRNSRDKEIKVALEEIFKIAKLRLMDLIQG